jgi:chemotaxis protein CheC
MNFLDEISKDSLQELFNIGMGKAGASLSEMVNEEIELSIPKVLCVPLHSLQESVLLDANKEICTLTQHFSNEKINAEAKLLFTEEKSLELVKIFLDKNVELKELTDLEEDALLEIGNVILNSFFGSISNILKIEFEGTIPNLNRSKMSQLFDKEKSIESKVVLAGYVDFSIVSLSITGYILLLIDLKILDDFLNKINESMVV